jgi:hypothetical protein
VPVEEESLRQISFDFCKDKRGVLLIFDDFAAESFDLKLFDPPFEVLCSLK